MSGRLGLGSRQRQAALSALSLLTTAVAIGIWVNLLTEGLNGRGSPSFFTVVGDLGWKNAWLVLAVASVGVQLVTPIVLSRRAANQYDALLGPMLEKVLELTVKSLQALHPSARLNGRYFSAQTESGRDVLIREDSIAFMTEDLPWERGLEKVDVEEDPLVICESFRTGTPIYRELPKDHTEQYGARIKHRIDPQQSWVLACPIFRRGGKPLGVICLYGKKPPARNPGDVTRLTQVAANLSDVFGRALQGSELLTRAE